MMRSFCSNQTRRAAESANYSPLLAQHALALVAADEMLFQEDGISLVQPFE